MCSPNDCSRPATSRRPWVSHLGGKLAAAVGVIEIGGLNAVAAVLAAARLGAPVLDGDLMGRAFPRINRTTVAVTGHRAAPPALVGPGADTVIVPTASRRPWPKPTAAPGPPGGATRRRRTTGWRTGWATGWPPPPGVRPSPSRRPRW
ncbi:MULTISPECIES: S-methyl thiohydantoin desulfurase domain-containing protein [Streptomyces]|uniref:S-methyl thiohydantoin desulfurase domain-containing protein n=1 Tax=Streptomyces TaxID=1883 RepID=UPI0013685CED|nr:DUF917 family protein [Streptomyces sp. SID2888]MYV47663.1 DUF917 family protein [Streptomyces sp. SID2888]